MSLPPLGWRVISENTLGVISGKSLRSACLIGRWGGIPNPACQAPTNPFPLHGPYDANRWKLLLH